MPTIVRLTSTGNEPIWVNLDNVAWIVVVADGQTRICFNVASQYGGQNAVPHAVDVKEHPDQILGPSSASATSPPRWGAS